MLFFIEGKNFIVLHGFIKKSQKTPREELETAKARKKLYKRTWAVRPIMKTTKHPNHGTSLEDVLREDGNLEAATAYAPKRVIAWQLQQEMERRKLTKTAMAKLMQTSRGQLDRVLSPDDGNVTLDTLQKAAKAVGRSLRLELA